MGCKFNISDQNIDNNCTNKSIEQQYKFFSEIVHESKNALTACEGFIQFMLIKKIFNAEYLEIVLSELRRTTDILNSYKHVAAPDNNEEYCNLNNIISEVCTLLSSRFNLRQITLNLSFSDIPVLEVDCNKIKQVILNLLENAIDAIGKMGTISITTFYDDNKITLIIKDSGCGIDDEVKEKLFTPFFTTKTNGTGLGLHISKSIIEGYGGTIKVESLKGNGTEFTIELPLKPDT
ncbi:sporulation kinase A [Oxobacter pfennigii]|uniref:histidine kinase n=1 Tax=Oxobacter pfennigii TaxID=36849 RepID=A0A0N8NTE3_9CLOT|nr:HAMP domain-containing sensor histidine kinase [Oxobacter pfennigii]KPU44592.1 sporulation kinase A [Oxobacter pfennigii]